MSLLRGPKMNATRRRQGGRPQREAMFALSGAVRHVFAIFAGIRNPATDGGTKAAGSLGGGRRPVAAGIAASTSRHQRGFRPSARPGAGAGRGGPRCLPRCGRTRGRARRAGTAAHRNRVLVGPDTPGAADQAGRWRATGRSSRIRRFTSSAYCPAASAPGWGTCTSRAASRGPSTSPRGFAPSTERRGISPVLERASSNGDCHRGAGRIL